MIKRNSLTGSGNRTVGYVRRSTDKQEQSIEDQKRAISAYIKARISDNPNVYKGKTPLVFCSFVR